MKYSLLRTSSGCRRGVISGVDRLPHVTMETPNLLLCTQGGLLPHIIPDVLDLISPKPQAILLPLAHMALLHDRMKSTPMDIAQYIGLPHLITILTVMDPLKPRLEGFHKGTDILTVNARSGHVEYDSTTYMELVDRLKPDLFMSLCDGDTKKDSSRKRTDKSMSRSLAMLRNCLSHVQEKEMTGRMLVPLEGGTDDRFRRKYSKDVLELGPLTDKLNKWTAGVVIDGIGQFGEEVADRDVEKFAKHITSSLDECDIEGFRLLPGAWQPSAVFELIELGIDLFDTSYPNIVTDRGGALLLPIDQPHDVSNKTTNFEISLKDPLNAELFEPIMVGCDCHCCKTHTRAYIHHLLNVKEMLASVLLNIHNVQQYYRLFSAIRNSLDNNTFHKLKSNFTR